MLTNLRIRNFKRFEDVSIELGQTVVFIGPNNSGKTTALQALALWEVGVRKWNDKRGGKTSPGKRPGVTINRRDLISTPVPDANLLWRELHVRDVQQVNGKAKQTNNVRIDIIVDGVSEGKDWSCGLEFDYANEESFYCRPCRLDDGTPPQRMLVPEQASRVHVAFLPPMSGLAAVEPKAEPGRINVLIGEGQTAQVLRNLCYQIHNGSKSKENWSHLEKYISRLFGVRILPPRYIADRGEITMAFEEQRGLKLDLSAAGRGLQQTLLLLAHLLANPGSVLLLDEPDAHLEILRQRQIYQLLTRMANDLGSQIIAASHSEIVLNEAADRDVVVAFVGAPHRIDDRGSQVAKSLKEIGYEHYYQAEQCGWVLYLEGSTDLAVLRALAERLNDQDALKVLECPYVDYVGNDPNLVRRRFWGLRDAVPQLRGIALFDRLERPLPVDLGTVTLQWKRREMECYACNAQALLDYARAEFDPLAEQFMQSAIEEVTAALKTLRKPNPWSPECKITDEFLDPVFEKFFDKLGTQNLLRKTDYHVLAGFMAKETIDPEVQEKLTAIVEVAKSAKPRDA